jgi:hypothetical protein
VPLWRTPQQISLYRLVCQEAAASDLMLDGDLLTLYTGILQAQDVTTRQRWTLLFGTYIEAHSQPVAYIQTCATADAHSRLHALQVGLSEVSATAWHAWLTAQGVQKYDLTDVYAADRERLFCIMLQRQIEQTEAHIQTLYHDSVGLLAALTALHMPVPMQLRTSMEFALTHQLRYELAHLPELAACSSSPAGLSAELEQILTLSQQHQLHLDTTNLCAHLERALQVYVQTFARLAFSPSMTQPQTPLLPDQMAALHLLHEILDFLEKAEHWGLKLNKTVVQDMVYDVVEAAVADYVTMLQTALQVVRRPLAALTTADQRLLYEFFLKYKHLQEYLQCAQRLNFNIDRYRRVLFAVDGAEG